MSREGKGSGLERIPLESPPKSPSLTHSLGQEPPLGSHCSCASLSQPWPLCLCFIHSWLSLCADGFVIPPGCALTSPGQSQHNCVKHACTELGTVILEKGVNVPVNLSFSLSLAPALCWGGGSLLNTASPSGCASVSVWEGTVWSPPYSLFCWLHGSELDGGERHGA